METELALQPAFRMALIRLAWTLIKDVNELNSKSETEYLEKLTLLLASCDTMEAVIKAWFACYHGGYSGLRD